MLHRLRTLVVKELLSYLRDPRTRTVLIGPPLVQLLVFSFAATLDVRNIDVAVLDRDAGTVSATFVERLAASSFVGEIVPVHDERTLARLIDEREVLLGVVLDADFSRRVLAGGVTVPVADAAAVMAMDVSPDTVGELTAVTTSEAGAAATVQVLLDGRRANAAQVALGYTRAIAAGLGAELAASLGGGASAPLPGVLVRHRYNPNLAYRWFIVPSLSGVLALMIALLVTALSIARERELGTFDQLLVSPISTPEIILGKTIPAVLIGAALGGVMIAAGIVLFRIPFTGNLALLLATLPLYILSGVGIGLAVSAVSRTQQQAILGAFAVVIPIVLTSGFATPVENMPGWLQSASLANPLRHFLVIVQGSFLKALPPGEVLANALPLVAISALSLGAATAFVRGRLE